MKSFRQHDPTDCGPCCLAWIAQHYHLGLSLANIRLVAGTDRTGTSALGLVQAASKLGFLAKGVSGPFDSLSKIPLPAIGHFEMKKGLFHFMVMCKYTPKHILVMDPADGERRKISHEEFKKIWTGIMVLIVPGDSFTPKTVGLTPLARFWSLMRPHLRTLVQASCGAIVLTLLGLSSSIYVGKILDSVIVDGNRQLLNLLGVGMLVILLARIVLGTVQNLLLMRTAQALDSKLMMGYFHHVMHLPQRFFDTMRIGEVTSRFGDAARIRSFINGGVLNLILSVLTLIIAFVVMCFFSWQMALISCALMGAYSLIFFINNYINRKYMRKIMEGSADLSAQVVESLNAAPTIKRFQIEWLASIKTENKFIGLLRLAWNATMAGIWTDNAGNFLTSAYSIVLMWFGASLVLDAQLTPGKLMTCTSLAGYLTGPINSLLSMNQTIQSALIAADRLYEIMDLERDDVQGNIELTTAGIGDIQIDNITFNHPGRTQVLVDLSLRIPKGTITALTGESGCGKSTLLALIQRLYPVETGRIIIGNLDLREITVQSLRKTIGVIPQQIDLLSGTLIENIALGQFPPDMDRVEKACQQAGLVEFIKSLPQGYSTLLNEDGNNFSGGQRQRLALARVFYFDPEILLLDEPSSALDAESERILVQTLEHYRAQGRTLVVVAHNPRLVALGDQVIRIAGGKAIVVSSNIHSKTIRPNLRVSEVLEFKV